MKKMVSLLVMFVLLFSMGTMFTAFAEDGIRIVVNGEEISFDAKPFIEEGRTMVPMRAIFEAMGAEVSWDAENYTATATKGNHTISFSIDSTWIFDAGFVAVNNCEVAPKIVEDRTFVPLRAIGETLDCNVAWDEATRTVYVDEKTSPMEVVYQTEQIVLDTDHEVAKIAVSYTYPVVVDGKDFMTAENVALLNQKIAQQRSELVDVHAYANTFAREFPVIIEHQSYGYPTIELDFTTRLYTSEKYGTVSILTGVNMPWTGGWMDGVTLDKDTMLRKELHECFADKEPEELYNEIYSDFLSYDEYVRYGKESLAAVPGVVPFVISDNDLRVYMSNIELTGVGRVNGYFTAILEY